MMLQEKPHKCSLCLKSFPTPGDLRSHQYVHSGAWPFRCTACGRGFSKQTNLRNHLFLHTGTSLFYLTLIHYVKHYYHLLILITKERMHVSTILYDFNFFLIIIIIIGLYWQTKLTIGKIRTISPIYWTAYAIFYTI
jgi:hypothetical protein